MNDKLNILVVDDDKGIRDLFIRMLSKKHNIKTADCGAIAIDLVSEYSFDLAFLDMRLPGINGCETFIELKKIDPDITGVIMTGYCDEDLRLESYLAGTVRYLNKPFDVQEINELIINEVDFKRESKRKDK